MPDASPARDMPRHAPEDERKRREPRRSWSIADGKVLADHTAALLVLGNTRHIIRTSEELKRATKACLEHTRISEVPEGARYYPVDNQLRRELLAAVVEAFQVHIDLAIDDMLARADREGVADTEAS